MATSALAAEQSPAPASGAPRGRVGGSVGLGPGSFGLARAASARVGVQIASFLATSYQISRAGSSDFWSTQEDTFTSHALLVEFMAPGTMFTVGGGPSIAVGTVEHGCFSILTACDPPRTSERYTGQVVRCAFSDWYDPTLPVGYGEVRAVLPKIEFIFVVEAGGRRLRSGSLSFADVLEATFLYKDGTPMKSLPAKAHTPWGIVSATTDDQGHVSIDSLPPGGGFWRVLDYLHSP